MWLPRHAIGRAESRYGMPIEACGLIPASEFASRIFIPPNTDDNVLLHFRRDAWNERICHDALSFKASALGRGFFL